MSDILVVGGGFLGSHIAAGLQAGGQRVTVLSRTLPTGDAEVRMSAAGVAVIVGDAADLAAVEAGLDRCADVVWCAGGLLPADSNLDPLGDIHASLPPLLTVLQALRARRRGSMTFLSSGGTVYGNPTVLPVPEDHPTRPITSYGVLKVAAEHYVSIYAELYGVPGLILRCANVYGEGQRGDRSQGLVAAVLERVRRGQPVPVFGDGTSVRDYVHVADVVDVVAALRGLAHPPAVVNVGSGVGTTVDELLADVEAVTGSTVRRQAFPARAGDVDRVVLDIGRLRSLVSFTPLGLEVGLRRTWAATMSDHPSCR
jgi:UDP-glucose 4-epimerase